MPTGSTVILNFHGLGEPQHALDPGERDVWVGRDAFEAMLDVVAGRPHVRLTFDDGNTSDRTIALDALRRRDLRASFFVAAGLLGQPGHLSEEDVRALADAGMTVGSHGHAHRAWTGLDEDGDRAELVEARRRLSGLVGRDVDEAACPFGAYDRRVLRRLRDLGYRRVYTSDRGPADPAAWLQPRNTVRCDDTPESVEKLVSSPRSGFDVLMRDARIAWKRWRTHGGPGARRAASGAAGPGRAD